LSECEQQCTSVQQALTSLQFQLQDAQGREERGADDGTGTTSSRPRGLGAQEEEAGGRTQRIGMKQPKPTMIMEHDNEVADDHIAVISETEKKLHFVGENKISNCFKWQRLAGVSDSKPQGGVPKRV
jgi:hypothetical protein